MSTFLARFSGTPCDKCEERIREGQEVLFNAADRLEHAVCPEQIDLDEPTTPLCDGCFQYRAANGSCGCD